MRQDTKKPIQEPIIRSFQSEILSTHAGMDSTSWQLGLAPSLDDEVFFQKVKKLSEECTHSNPFYLPEFLITSARLLEDDEVSFLYLSQTIGSEETLKFFTPVKRLKTKLSRQKVLSSFVTEYTPLGDPLILETSSNETMNAYAECIRNIDNGEIKAILLEHVAKSNPFINALYTSTTLSDRLLLTKGWKRAGLKPVKNLDYIGTYFSGKRKQRLRVAQTRLEELGTVTFERCDAQACVSQAFDEFLNLELKSWKGEQNTALANRENTKEFSTTVIAKMATAGKCKIHILKLDGKTLACLVSLNSNGYYYPWKIAFDANYAKYSVGNLLAAHATQEFASLDSFKGLDSLADEQNTTSLRFWPDENEFYTMVIGIGSNASRNTIKITNEIGSLKNFKHVAKRFVKKHPFLDYFVSSLRM
jgi:hypothetical protein